MNGLHGSKNVGMNQKVQRMKKPFAVSLEKQNKSIRVHHRAKMNGLLRAMDWAEIALLAKEPISDYLHNRARKLLDQHLRPMSSSARSERTGVLALTSELRRLSTKDLQCLLATGKHSSTEQELIASILRSKTLAVLRSMATSELQSLARQQKPIDFPVSLVLLVLGGRNAPASGDTVTDESWRDQ